jgi:hypothetical protein
MAHRGWKNRRLMAGSRVRKGAHGTNRWIGNRHFAAACIAGNCKHLRAYDHSQQQPPCVSPQHTGLPYLVIVQIIKPKKHFRMRQERRSE